MSSKRSRRIVEAEKFVLKDDNGKDRAVLCMGDFGPVLSFNDPRGLPRLTLELRGEGPMISLCDPNGAWEARLEATKEGAVVVVWEDGGKRGAGVSAQADGPDVWLSDGECAVRAKFTMANGHPCLRLSDAQGTCRLELAALKDGPHVSLFGADGRPFYSVGPQRRP